MKNEVRISIVPNKSKTYLLPILDEQVEFKFKENLLNSYCSFKDNDELFTFSEYLHDSTNNEAEYTALIRGLEYLL